ncbi:DUF3822 family protein [Gramella sp. GC03-9]|uniref:DUF3822 family protein n=1 Tax=Christiangramia oceanisediminis TaxID=2920386 RepID=A0A9X2R957_9FLAO|nr:DUF3822 family protein [Gramella oceanisediminis]MCP9200707.1 DUF3822 family protein [Gramella oceanisediminis]
MDLTDMVEKAITTKETNSNNKLSIQVSLNGLSFCILDKENSKIDFFKSIQFDRQLDPVKLLERIEKTYESNEELQQPVTEVSLIFNNSLFSLVPKELFDEDNASNYLKFNTRILKTDYIAHDSIRDEIVNIYIPYANITNYFFEKYGEFEYKHSLSVLIESLLELPKEANPRVYLHAGRHSYDLVIIENGKLIFANSFDYETPEDFLYYLLFTAEQLELNPQTFDLVLLGRITRESKEYKLTWNYVRNISFMGPFHSYDFENDSNTANELSEYLLIKSLA